MASPDEHAPKPDRTDQLAVEPPTGSLLVFNYGDAAFLSATRFPEGIPPHEAIFLRLLAYLAFIDEIAVPGRLILDSGPLMQALELAAPLLRSGLIRPERRATVQSFSELASERRLPPLGHERASRLDEIAKKPRLFRYDELQETYTQILLLDLAAGGAFRTTISGARSGRLARPLDRAHADYESYGDGTPENFASIVTRYVPALSRRALRWAMARYYSTPTLFDDKNLREMPEPAARLLLSAQVKEQIGLPEPTIAPVDLMIQHLWVSMEANRVTLDADRFCEAILHLRDKIPEARRVSKRIIDTAKAHAVSREISEGFAKELRRQQQKREPGHVGFLLVSALIGTAAGMAADLFVGPGLSVLTGLGTGASADRIQRRLSHAWRKRDTPWIVAVELMDKASPHGR